MSSRSRRPYLVRAVHEWAVDNGFTPHLLVAADYPGVTVPREHVQEGRITLNISPMAVQNLDLSAEPIWFSARFGGRPFDVIVPSGAVLAIFARENGEGVVFGEVEEPADAEPAVKAEKADTAKPDGEEPSPERPKPGGRPHLRVVK